MRNPTRTWVFIGFGVAPLPEAHQSPIRVKANTIIAEATIYSPWHVVLQNTVSTRRMSIPKDHKSCGLPEEAVPLWSKKLIKPCGIGRG